MNKNENRVHAENITESLISYYPIKHFDLQDKLNLCSNLTYSDQEIGTGQDRLGRDYEAIIQQTNITLEGNEMLNFTNGLTIFFRAKYTLPEAITDEKFHIVFIFGSYTNIVRYFTSQKMWQSYSVCFNQLPNQVIEVNYYVNGTLIYGFLYEYDGYIQQITIGDQYGGFLNLDDIAIFNRNLSENELVQLNQYPQDLDLDLPSIDDECEENLKNLQSRNVTIDFDFINFEHIYTLDFGDFQILENCYNISLYLNGTHLTYGIDPHRQQISTSFPNNQSLDLGCYQNYNQTIECEFSLELKYGGVVQMVKFFSSEIYGSLDNIENGLQLTINTDQSQQIAITQGNIVQTEINICQNETCSEYSTTGKIIRNEISYIELKVTTPEYQSYYPVHKSLKLDNKEFLPENLQQVQTWNQTGRIIYQIKPHISTDDIYLLIKIGLVQSVNGTRRFLSEQQVEQQSSESQDKFGEQDFVGKQIVISIVDKDDFKQEEQERDNTALILGITLGSVAFVSFSISVVALTVLKFRKMALIAEAAKVVPVPNTQDTDVNNFGMSTPNSIRNLKALTENNI